MNTFSNFNIRPILLVIILILTACSAGNEVSESITPEIPANNITQETIAGGGYVPALLTEPISKLPGNVLLPSGGTADYFYLADLQIPLGLAWGPDDLLYVADYTGHRIATVSREGEIVDLGLWQTLQSLQDEGPVGIAFNSSGDLYFHNGVSLFRQGSIRRNLRINRNTREA